MPDLRAAAYREPPFDIRVTGEVITGRTTGSFREKHRKGLPSLRFLIPCGAIAGARCHDDAKS